MEKNKLSAETPEDIRREVFSRYLAYESYCFAILRKNSSLRFSWLFYLNTGGLAASVTVLALNGSYRNISLFLLSIFFIGLALNLIALELETGGILEREYVLNANIQKVMNGEMRHDKYFHGVLNTSVPIKIINAFQRLSGVAFVSGLIIGVVFLFYK